MPRSYRYSWFKCPITFNLCLVAYKDNRIMKKRNKQLAKKHIKEIEDSQQLSIDIVTNRYLVEYLNKGGACRQTYVEAINKEVVHKAFFIYNDGTITSITDICNL